MSTYSQTMEMREPVLASPGVSSLAAMLVPSLGAAVFAVALVHVLFLSAGTRTLFRDSDTGWHIRNGEAMLRTGSVPRIDGFSYTAAGKEWLSWEWASDVALGAAHRWGGPAGVAFVAALAIALAAWGAVRLSLALGGNLLFTAVAAGLLLGSTSIHWLARPHVFSWLISLAFLAVAEQERRGLFLRGVLRGRRALYWLPALACLWANLHGSFLLGPAILAVYAIGEWLQELQDGAGAFRPGPAARRFALAGVASLAATFVNPYGWKLHAHVIAYLRDSYLMDHILEFRSFDFHSPGAIYVELFLGVAAAGTVAMIRQRAYGPALLSVAMLHLSFYSARHLPTSAVLLLPLSVAALTREAQCWPGLRAFFGYSERLSAIDAKVSGVALVALVLAGTLGTLATQAHADRVGFDPAMFPVKAADFLEQQGLDRRVFAKDQWGGYLIYRFDGRMQIFLDGRSDHYGRELLQTYAKVIDVKPGWDAVLRQYGVQFVLAPPEHALASVLALSPEWKRVYTDSVATVFERIG